MHGKDLIAVLWLIEIEEFSVPSISIANLFPLFYVVHIDVICICFNGSK